MRLAPCPTASNVRGMRNFFRIVIDFLRARFKSRAELEAENILLRHQLNVLKRRHPQHLQVKNSERIILALAYRFFPKLLSAIQIVRPETIIRWHRIGFKALWHWKSRQRGGRSKISKETRDLIREMSVANPLWGAPRIHGELKMLGIEIAQSTVAKYMIKRRGPPSQTWKTFLHNHTDSIASIDFLVVPTISFKLLYVFVVLGHGRRKILHIAVTAHPTVEWTAQQIIEAFPWGDAPTHLIRDNDAIFGATFKKQLAAMGIRDGPTAFRSPWQNAYVERVIGSIRRECLDHIIVFNAAHLRRIMKAYAEYYNSARTHLSLSKDAPVSRPIKRSGNICAAPHLGGLHHEYDRIE